MHLLLYIPWLIKEIFAAGFKLAYHTLKPGRYFRPVIIYYPLRVTTAWQVFWFSTSITVTPTTLSMGLREPARDGEPYTLIVHVLEGQDPSDAIASLAEMEERLNPKVKGIDHGVPGQGDHETLDERYYLYPDPLEEDKL